MVVPLRRAFSAVFYTWVGPLLRLGRKRPLQAVDLPPLPQALDPAAVDRGFLQLEKSSGQGLLRRLLWLLRREMLLMTGLLLLRGLGNIAAPLCVHRLLSLLASSGAQVALPEALGVAALLCTASVVEALAFQHYVYWAVSSSMRVTSGLNARLYRQLLRLSRKARQDFPTGEVINLLSSDCDAVSDFGKTTVEILYSAVLVLAVISLLYRFLGPAALAAVAVLTALSPGTALLGRGFVRVDARSMQRRDERVSMIAQVLSGIRIVKFFAWQERILAEVRSVRAGEIRERRRLAYLRGVAAVFDIGPITLVSVATFGTYVGLGHRLDAATVFACLGLLAQLEYPFSNITNFISSLAEAKASAQRIDRFLAADLLAAAETNVSAADTALGLCLNAVSIRYTGSDTNALTDIQLELKPGEAVAVVGPVGAGKTTLLHGILGELPLSAGHLHWPGLAAGSAPRTALVPQEAFIRNTTLRENLRFGTGAEDLQPALAACALLPDIQRLAGGLDTEIGEHGVNLSGGQKQRVGLARLLLSRPGLALLDDPLAAVDGQTEDHLVEHLLFGALATTTRLVTTHRLKHLERFDRVVFLERGQIAACGPYLELLEQHPRFASFVAATRREESAQAALPAAPGPGVKGEALRITDDEDRVQGAVRGSVYATYLQAMGGTRPLTRLLMLTALPVSVALVTVLPIVQTAWLSVWTDSLSGANAVHGAPLNRWLRPLLGDELHNIGIYAVFGSLLLTAFFGQSLLWALRAVEASRLLHDQALTATLAAPLRFFDATPIGRILNRFARDVDAVERHLPWSFQAIVRALFATCGSIFVLLSVLPLIILAIVPVLVVFYWLQDTYRRSARETQRLTSIASSPRFAHIKETLQGLPVIRSFHQTGDFLLHHEAAVREFQRMFHGMIVINRWFSIRVPLISSVVAFSVASGLAVSARLGVLAVGTVGFGLTYALRFWADLNGTIRAFSEVESRLTSVERLSHYAALPAEPETTLVPPLLATSAWPVAGLIEFKAVTARYAEHLPHVLHQLTLTIPAGSRVGLIGRTGSGKSTIFQLLFRFLPVASGELLIDNVDVRRVPLPRLRRAIAIIPQDPTLFKGRLRDNLDRFEQHTDQALWAALGRVHMREVVAALPGGLLAVVQEDGHNFSQGQRQLLCLARALLVDAKILVIDEATASVDMETDALIQEAIRRECAGKTVLIIAHRLWTVRDCDLVFELAEGRIKRCFTPHA